MIPYSFTPYANFVFLRAAIGVASAILVALAAACSAAPTPTPTPTLAPTAAPAPAPPIPRARGLLVREPESFEGYTLYARGAVYLIDHAGQLIRAWEPDGGVELARLLDNGNLLTNRNMEIDADGNAVWEYRYPQHHDLLKMPNGNVLILSRLAVPLEEAIALGVNSNSTDCPDFRATHIVEVQPTGPTDGEIVWEWSAFDHIIQDFDPEKPNYGAVADHPELIDINFNVAGARCTLAGRLNWQHANALDYNPELDQIMITVRHFSEIWIIDHSTSADEAAGHSGGNGGKGGDLLYRWGNPRAYQRGTAADQRLFWPHDARWIPEGLPGAGNVLVFNNGNEYPGFERGYSSVDEVALPADGYNYRSDEGAAYGPDEVVWRYAADPPDSFYAPIKSGAQRLPNGNTLITDTPASRIFEVTREGKMVWGFRPPNVDELYRAYRYALDYPGLRSLDLTPYHAVYADAVAAPPVARSVFDLYATGGALTYVKEACDQSDTEARFFLHIVPVRAEDLPQERRERGWDNLDFDFFLRGALFDGKRCVAVRELPEYSIASIRTGQFTPDGELWSAEFAIGGQDGAVALTPGIQ